MGVPALGLSQDLERNKSRVKRRITSDKEKIAHLTQEFRERGEESWVGIYRDELRTRKNESPILRKKASWDTTRPKMEGS